VSVLTRLARLEAQTAPAPPLPADPLAFAAACGFPALDPWQVEVLTGDWQRLLLNIARQVGKSSITALLALRTALHTPHTLVLALSPGERQSGELLGKCRDAYHALGQRGLVGTAEAEGALHLTLPNASRILALPGGEKGIRGFSAPALVILDEASRIADPLYHAVSPMLAISGGRLIMLSTPFGKRGVFYEAWTQGAAAWQRLELWAHDCPRYSAAFLAQERRTLPPAIYRQEFECSFEALEGSVFGYEDIHAALVDDMPALWPAATEVA
jgi:hypothetical protein